MYDELLYIRKKNKSLKSDLEGKFKVLRQDFDEWKAQEPPVILPDPNKYIYQSDQKLEKKKRSKKNKNEEKIIETIKEENSIIQPNVLITKPPSQTQTELTLEQKLRKLGKELPELNEGEEVLAKWPDDGWYYRSIVKKNVGDNKYQVEDSLKDIEIIKREDIISEINDSKDTFEVTF
jgi:hypothetical protein